MVIDGFNLIVCKFPINNFTGCSLGGLMLLIGVPEVISADCCISNRNLSLNFQGLIKKI